MLKIIYIFIPIVFYNVILLDKFDFKWFDILHEKIKCEKWFNIRQKK